MHASHIQSSTCTTWLTRGPPSTSRANMHVADSDSRTPSRVACQAKRHWSRAGARQGTSRSFAGRHRPTSRVRSLLCSLIQHQSRLLGPSVARDDAVCHQRAGASATPGCPLETRAASTPPFLHGLWHGEQANLLHAALVEARVGSPTYPMSSLIWPQDESLPRFVCVICGTGIATICFSSRAWMCSGSTGWVTSEISSLPSGQKDS